MSSQSDPLPEVRPYPFVALRFTRHTPEQSEVLGRPSNERAMLIMPVGYPAPDARVPDLGRKPIDEIVVWR